MSGELASYYAWAPLPPPGILLCLILSKPIRSASLPPPGPMLVLLRETSC